MTDNLLDGFLKSVKQSPPTPPSEETEERESPSTPSSEEPVATEPSSKEPTRSGVAAYYLEDQAPEEVVGRRWKKILDGLERLGAIIERNESDPAHSNFVGSWNDVTVRADCPDCRDRGFLWDIRFKKVKGMAYHVAGKIPCGCPKGSMFSSRRRALEEKQRLEKK